MTKDEYISLLEEAEQSQLKGIIFVVHSDSALSNEDRMEIQDEYDHILDEIIQAKCEASDARYEEEYTDDELGFTQM